MKSNFSFLFGIALACFSVTRGESQGTSIQVVRKSCMGQKLSLRVQDLLSEYTIVRAESRLTYAGIETLKVQLADSVRALVQIGDSPQSEQNSFRRHKGLFGAQSNLQLSLDEVDVSFEGDLSIINQYLADSRQVSETVMDRANALGGRFGELSAGEKEKFRQSFGEEFKPLHLLIRQDNRVPEKLKEMIVADNDFIVRWRKS